MDDMEVSVGYNKIKSNPHSLLQLINKFVKVLLKREFICGFVHAIDPINHSIMLLEISGDKFKATLIPGHAIVDVLEDYSMSNVQPPTSQISVLIPKTNNYTARKEKLMSWLQENLLTVTESGDNIAFGSVLILPPYNVSDVCTTNPIVAMQVKNIIKNMPDNF